jgi:hypothetical protein
VIRRVAALLVAGVLLCACGTISASTAMTSWEKNSSFHANAHTLYEDVKHSAKDLANLTLSTNDLHTFCQVLYSDDGSMQSSLPTPDEQATKLLNSAYKDFAAGSYECYSAKTIPGDRARALSTFSQGAALLSEATARIDTVAS